ncbi:MAG: polyphenol oxidase family protein [Phycisphaerales bacterium]|jgi:polyphenol oxidase|nr:polyphenol oxidase family protein [Phycisphaerales bacterium]
MTPLHPRIFADGTEVLQSRLLTDHHFPHAFSTRSGPQGVLFDLARLGESRLGTSEDVLLANLSRFAGILGVDASGLSTARQVHGTKIVHGSHASHADADVLVSDSPHGAIAVRTADCVPILLACPDTRIVAAVHAGWRGLVANAPAIAIAHLESIGVNRRGLLAAIGPAIGAARFEIGSEVADRFQASGLGDSLRTGNPRPHADLFDATIRRLLDSGIARESIDGEPCCTSEDSRFFSHRGESGRTGRHLSGIIGEARRSAESKR